MPKAKYPDIIPLIDGGFQAMSVNYAIDHGAADPYRSEENKGTPIDLTTDSPGKRAIDEMLASAYARIDTDPVLQQLLHKSVWNKQDRETWEEGLAAISQDLISQNPRFGTYRLDRDKPMSVSLTDIDPNTNFHCEPMATLRAVMIQKMENHYLAPSWNGNQYKRQVDYYIAAGQGQISEFLSGDKPKDYRQEVARGEALHAFILSPLTGNYIEGTVSSPENGIGMATSPYNKNIIKDYKFEDFLAGFPYFASNDRNLTEGYDGTPEAHALAMDRLKAIRRGDYDYLAGHTANQGQGYNRYLQTVYSEERVLLLRNQISKDMSYQEQSIIDFTQDSVTSTVGVRNYDQLLKDSNDVDFFMSRDELNAAASASRMRIWARTNPGAANFLSQRPEKTMVNSDWQLGNLVSLLKSNGMRDVWVARPLEAGKSFEQTVQAAYDGLPEALRTVKGEDGKDKPLPFEDYLAMCKAFAATQSKGFPEQADLVPILMNPKAAWLEFKESNGRDHTTYEEEDGVVMTSTTAYIIDRPGTDKDNFSYQIHSVIDGIATHMDKTIPLHITGTLPSPKTPLQSTETAAATTRAL